MSIFVTQVRGPSTITPAPESVVGTGGCILADYGARVPHPGHATELAAQVWRDLLVPMVAVSGISPMTADTPGKKAAGSGGNGAAVGAAAVAVGAAAAVAGTMAYQKQASAPSRPNPIEIEGGKGSVVLVGPRRVVPVNGVEDEANFLVLIESMTKHGWHGRPLLVERRADRTYKAWTGSHRIFASIAVGLRRIPVYVLDPAPFEAAGWTPGYDGTYLESLEWAEVCKVANDVVRRDTLLRIYGHTDLVTRLAEDELRFSLR